LTIYYILLVFTEIVVMIVFSMIFPIYVLSFVWDCWRLFTFFIKILHMYNIILSVGWVILQLLIICVKYNSRSWYAGK